MNDLKTVWKAGLLGVGLGVSVVVITGVVLFIVDRATGGNGVAGLAAAFLGAGGGVGAAEEARITINPEDMNEDTPLFIGLSTVPVVKLEEPPTGPDAGARLRAPVVPPKRRPRTGLLSSRNTSRASAW